MPWWAWLLTAWAGLAVAAAVLLGAVAAKARLGERATRRRHHREEAREKWRDAG